MPASTLRHYSAAPINNAMTAVVPAVPNARALAVSRISIAAETAGTVYIAIGATSANAGMIVKPINLVAGQVYETGGQAVVAGESLWVSVGQGFPNVSINVFGVEVDN
jgi:hypothetical protein